MKKSILSLLCFLSFVAVKSQNYPPKGLTGIALHNWLKDSWYTGKFQALGYTDARHAMYDDIDHKNGTLVGVYGGHVRPFTIGGSFNEAFPMTTEHTVPQSFFNSLEPMRSDIHHLFPSHINVNFARSNYPFMEIPDSTTTFWWIDHDSITTIPTSNIDMYSEEAYRSFEPREDHKGNVARAVFYFYTMYKNDVRTIHDCGNINDLYNWHVTEMVDNEEKTRNDRTEVHQGNRNPYIDYPELLGYAWGFTSWGLNPYLNFTKRSVAIHPNLADGRRVTIDLEISPVPTTKEVVDISVDENSTLDPSRYQLSRTSFTMDSGSAYQSFSIDLIGDAEGYLQLNLGGLSSAVEYGHNNTFTLYISKNLGVKEFIVESPINYYHSHTVILNKQHGFDYLEVLSLAGSVLEKRRIVGEEIVLKELPKGLYVLRFLNNARQYTQKISIR